MSIRKWLAADIAFALLVCGFSPATQAQARAGEVSGTSMEGALRRGDRDEVARILKARKSNKVLQGLAQAHLDGDVGRLIELSKQCIDGAFAAKAVLLANHCNRILASTYFKRGQIPDWAARMTWFLDTGLPALQATDSTNRATQSNGASGGLDYSRMSKLPKQKEIKLADRKSVPVLRFPSNAAKLWNPMIAITINGTEIKALLDTGTAASLGVSPETARRLDIKTIAYGLPIVRSGNTPIDPKRGNDAIGIAKNVGVGPLKIENMGVTVSPALQGLPAIVGLPMLQRFDTVSISDETIEFALVGGLDCQNSVPLTYSSVGKGIGKLLLPTKFKGHHQPAVLDTGLQGLFMVMGGMASKLGAERLPQREYRMRTAEGWISRSGAQTRMAVEIGNQTLVDPAAWLFPANHSDIPFYIGSSLLDKQDLMIDFSAAKACLLSRQPKTD